MNMEEHPNEAIAVPEGSITPDFLLPDPDGQLHSPNLIVDRSRLLLVFYRGDW
jgi:peroxiredoxin